MRISVLGAGGWGTTLAILLHYNGHDVCLWEFDKHYCKQLSKHRENKTFLPGIHLPEEMLITNDIEAAASDRHMIVVAIPTQFIRGAIKKISALNYKNTIFVSVAKGIENGSLSTVSSIIQDEINTLTQDQIGVLSGPSHAEEVSRKIPTAVVAASKSEETAKLIQSVFSNSYFRVYSSTDVIGVELGGALKNVIAVGAGIIDGAGFGDNTKAAIMTRGIREISLIGHELGARAETFSGLSGIGDLIVTCASQHSRNRLVGERVGKGLKLKEVLKSMSMVAEGVETARSVHELARKYNVETPICDAVYRILFEDGDPTRVTYELMARDMKPEY